MKDIEGGSKKQKTCHVVGLEELVKMAILPKAIHRFNAIMCTHDVYHRTRTSNPKTYIEPQKIQNYQCNP